MNKKVERNYLEINSVSELNEAGITSINTKKSVVKHVKPADFQINRFFYKNVGKKYNWVDRLSWTEKQWSEYVCDQKVRTYILKYENDLAGYFELIIHNDKSEVEIAYLGLLEEYLNKKIGSYLLSSAIKN